MINMYIDESGSINPFITRLKRYFVVGIVIPKDKEKLKRIYKLFVRKHMEELRKADKYNKMFDENGNFIELKGSCLTKELKIKFANFFCRNNLFEVRYIILDKKVCEDMGKNAMKVSTTDAQDKIYKEIKKIVK